MRMSLLGGAGTRESGRVKIPMVIFPWLADGQNTCHQRSTWTTSAVKQQLQSWSLRTRLLENLIPHTYPYILQVTIEVDNSLQGDGPDQRCVRRSRSTSTENDVLMLLHPFPALLD